MNELINEINGLLRSKTDHGVAAIFDNEHQLYSAAKKAADAGFRKFETLSPFPIHGMDDVMMLKRSPVPWFTFIFGTLGCSFGVFVQWWMSAVSWPIIVGGKPMFSLPAFIPIIFELTVLFGALCSVAGMLWLCELPKVDPPIMHPDITSHKFALFIPANDHGYDETKVRDMMKTMGASEIIKAEL
jgi:hypothetical protein